MTAVSDADRAKAAEGCPQAWHGGLSVGLLRECRYATGHRGVHRDAAGDLSWGGKLTAAEHAAAARLRAVVAAAEEAKA